jgi:hypothetical protein
MNDAPFTRLARTLKRLQGGHAIHMVAPLVHDASDQTFKGMHRSGAAPDTWVHHGSLLYHGSAFPQSFLLPNIIFIIKKLYYFINKDISAVIPRLSNPA